jgi:hypothetical protein
MTETEKALAKLDSTIDAFDNLINEIKAETANLKETLEELKKIAK